MEYYYNSEDRSGRHEIVLSELPDDASTFDTVTWSEERKKEFYEETLVPLSARVKKALKGKIKTHKAGDIDFSKGLLLTGHNFYIGDEVFEQVGLKLGTAEDAMVDEEQRREDQSRVNFPECQKIREAGVRFVETGSVDAVVKELDVSDAEASRLSAIYVQAVTDTPRDTTWGASLHADDFYLRPLVDQSETALESVPSDDPKSENEQSPREYIREYTGAVIREFDPDAVPLDEESLDAVREAAADYETNGPTVLKEVNTELESFVQTMSDIDKVFGNVKLAQEFTDEAGKVAQALSGFGETQKRATALARAVGAVPDEDAYSIPPVTETVVSGVPRSSVNSHSQRSRDELEQRVEELEEEVAELRKIVEE